jgi:hypothetical protein
MQTARPTPAAAQTGWRMFTIGLSRALRYWQVLVILWAATLLVTAPLAAMPSASLFDLLHRPVIADMAAGITATQVVDLVAVFGQLQRESQAGDIGAAPSSVQTGVLGLVVAAMLLPLIGGVVSAFLYGGVLLTYAEAPAPFRLRRFMWGCWRWFGSYLLLALMQTVLFLLVLVPVFFMLAGWLWQFGTAGWVLTGLLGLGLLLLWVIIFEAARAQTVANGRRNPLLGMRSGLRLLVAHPLRLIVFYCLGLLVWLVVHALFRLAVIPDLPLGLLPLALLVQQGFIVARLFTRSIRLAGLVSADRPGQIQKEGEEELEERGME